VVDHVRILTVNAGSSSLKLRVLDDADAVVASRDSAPDQLEQTVPALLDEAGSVEAVGHRVVHGGPHHVEPTRVDDALLADLTELVPLAPLHQPTALRGITEVRRLRPDLVSVACFDTAFHAGLPEPARTYAVPAEWRERFALRRYGFHGLSYAWSTRQAATLLGRDDARLVVAHLGSGASLAAVRAGRGVDTTMGFTPMEGVVMATRSGTVDPGLLLHLIRTGGLSADDVDDGLDRHGGLLALAGTKDMREVLDQAAGGFADATLARDVWVLSLVKAVGAMTASLGGLDALVFTGGIGERSAEVRRLAVDRLGHLGLGLDQAANEAGGDAVDISADGAVARTLVVAAREDAEIARGVRTVLAR
jgi:acetate kinase